MQKHVAIVDSFSTDNLDVILRTGKEQTRFLVRPHNDLITGSTNSIIYADTPNQRWIAASKWEENGVPWGYNELSSFMEENGDKYKYHTPSAFALSLYKSMTPEYTYLAQDGFRARMCQASLYGGRCEVLQFGKFEAHQYDINSSYPYAACSVHFPDPRKLHVVKPSIDNILKYDGVSRVSFTQYGYYPVLPIRFDNRIYYAECQDYVSHDAENETTYTHTELRNALIHGVRITAVHRQYISTESNLKPFDRFMEYCFMKREKTDRKIWKVIANSLIGRLAVKPGIMYTMRPAVSEQELMQYKPEQVGYYGVWCMGDEINPATDSNPLWAAMTLSVARNRLYNLTTPSDALYTDTDCVFTNYERSIYDIGTGLGQVKHKAGEYDIKGAKLYAKTGEDNIIVLTMKGEPIRSRTVETFDRARYTSERFMFPDGLTRPYAIDKGLLV